MSSPNQAPDRENEGPTSPTLNVLIERCRHLPRQNNPLFRAFFDAGQANFAEVMGMTIDEYLRSGTSSSSMVEPNSANGNRSIAGVRRTPLGAAGSTPSSDRRVDGSLRRSNDGTGEGEDRRPLNNPGSSPGERPRPVQVAKTPPERAERPGEAKEAGKETTPNRDATEAAVKGQPNIHRQRLIRWKPITAASTTTTTTTTPSSNAVLIRTGRAPSTRRRRPARRSPSTAAISSSSARHGATNFRTPNHSPASTQTLVPVVEEREDGIVRAPADTADAPSPPTVVPHGPAMPPLTTGTLPRSLSRAATTCARTKGTPLQPVLAEPAALSEISKDELSSEDIKAFKSIWGSSLFKHFLAQGASKNVFELTNRIDGRKAALAVA